MSNQLTIAILVKNSSKTLNDCLSSASFAQELLVLDDGSTDDSLDIAKKYGARIISKKTTSFAQKREILLKETKTSWLFYLDADESIGSELQAEILEIISQNPKDSDPISAYLIVRDNYFLGTQVYTDKVHRLFLTASLSGWTGDVHESPVYTGKTGTLSHLLKHVTHTDIFSMLEKTNAFSEAEAQLRLDAHHPPVFWWRLIRIALTFFASNYFGKSLYRYGRTGLFESYFQMIDKLVVYVKLWERQQVLKSNTDIPHS